MAKKNEESYVAKLGLKVDGSNLKTIERQARLIEVAFSKIGERMPNFKRMGIHDIAGMFKELQKAAEQTNMTFTKLNKTTIEFRRAFGDNVFETGKMNANGVIKGLERHMSEGARISKQYADLSSGDAAAARQTKMSNKIIESLGGNKATKTQWKNELVEQTNNMAEATDKILSELSSDLGAHISKMTNRVNKAGEVVKRIVEVQLNAYQKLRVELNRIQLDNEGNFGISRGKQTVTDTSSTALPKDYNALLTQRVQAEKDYQKAVYDNNEYIKTASQERIRNLDAEILKLEELAVQINVSNEAMEKMQTAKAKASNAINNTVAKYEQSTEKRDEEQRLRQEKESVNLLSGAYEKLKAAQYGVFESDLLGKTTEVQVAAQNKLTLATQNYNDVLKLVGQQILELDSYKQKQIATDEKWQDKTRKLTTTGLSGEYSSKYDERIVAEKAYWQAVVQGNGEGALMQQQYIANLNAEIAALRERATLLGVNEETQKVLDKIQSEKELALARAQQIGEFKAQAAAEREQHRQTKEKINEVIASYRKLADAKYALAETAAYGGTTDEQLDAQKRLVEAQNEYNEVTGRAGKEITDLAETKKGMADVDDKLTSKLRNLHNQTNKAVKGLSEFGKTFYNVFAARASWSIISRLIESFSSLISITKELDDAMTDLQIVTGQTNKEAQETIGVYTDLAVAMGTTTQAIAEGNLEWLRQGKSVEESMQLVRASTMLSKIGAMEASTATTLLTATLNGFNLEAEKAENVVDKLVAVDIAYATSANEVAKALQYTAASAQMAGIELDTLVGMITVVSDVSRRAPETIGQSFKTMIARMNNIKIGKFVDDETGEALNDVEKVLGSLGIKLRDSKDSFRDLDQVMAEIAGRWDEFTDIEKNAIAVAVAGQRQRENMIILFENWDEVIKATNISLESAGTSAERYEEVMDSLDAKLNQLKTNWEAVVNNLELGDVLKRTLDVANGILSTIGKWANPFTATAAVVALFSSRLWKTVDVLRSMKGAMGESQFSIQSYIASVRDALAQQKVMNSVLTSWNSASMTQQVDPQFIKSLAAGNQELEQLLTMKSSLVKINGEAKLSEDELSTAFKTTTASVKISTVALKALNAAITGLAVAAVIYALTKGLELLAEATKPTLDKLHDLREEMEELESSINSLTNSIESNKQRIAEITNDPYVTSAEKKEIEYLETQNKKLERQLELKQQLAQIKQKEADALARKYLQEPEESGVIAQTGLGLELMGLFATGALSGWSRSIISPFGGPIGGHLIDKHFGEQMDEAYYAWGDSVEQKVYKEAQTPFQNLEMYRKSVEEEQKRLKELYNDVNATSEEINAQELKVTETYQTYSDQLLKVSDSVADLDPTSDLYKQYSKKLVYEEYQAKSLSAAITGDTAALAEWQEEQLSALAASDKFAKKFEKIQKLGEKGLLDYNALNQIDGLAVELLNIGLTFDDIIDKFNGVNAASLSTADGLAAFQKNVSTASVILKYYLTNGVFDNLSGAELTEKINKEFKFIPQELRSTINQIVQQYQAGAIDVSRATDAFDRSSREFLTSSLIKESNNRLSELFGSSVSDAIDTYSEVASVLEHLASAYEDVAAAELEVAENGKISASTLLKLISSGDDYVDLLQKTESGYVLVDNAAEILLKTKIAEAKCSAQLQLQQAEENLEMYRGEAAALESAKANLTLAKSKLAVLLTAEGRAEYGYNIFAYLKDLAEQKSAIMELEDFINNSDELEDPEQLKKDIEDAQKRLDLLKELGNTTFLSDLAGGDSDSKDANKEAFERAYNDLKHRLAMNEITQQVYFDDLEVLYKKHFSDLTKYQEDYNKYEEEVYDGRRELFNAQVSDLERNAKLLGHQDGTEEEQIAIYVKLQEKVHERANYYRERGEEENKEHIQALGDQWWEYQNYILGLYDDIKTRVLDNLQKDIDRINDEIDDYTTTIDYATYVIEQQIEAIEDENDALEDQKEELEGIAETWSSALAFINDIIDERIALLEEQKEALEKENDEEERAIELEEKRQALERAKTQKTIRVYDAAKGFIWTTDQQAIDEAQKEYDEALKNDKIAAIDEEIEALQKQKDAWGDVTDTYQKEQNELIAKELLGSDLQKRILNGDYQALLEYTEKMIYLNDKKIDKTEEKIESNKAEIESWQELKDAWEEIPELYKVSQDQLIAHQIIGENAEREILERRLKLVSELAKAYSSLSDMSTDLQKEYDTIDKKDSKDLADEGKYSKQYYTSTGSSSSGSSGSGSNKTGYQLNSSDKAAIDNEIKYLENMKANDSDAGNKQWASEMLNEVKYWSDLANNSDDEGVRKWGAQQLADNKIIPQFSTGGMMYSTGLAMLHGSKNRPEMVLNYDQIKALSQSIKNPDSSSSVVYKFENVTIKSDNPSDMFNQLKQYAITHSRNK